MTSAGTAVRIGPWFGVTVLTLGRYDAQCSATRSIGADSRAASDWRTMPLRAAPAAASASRPSRTGAGHHPAAVCRSCLLLLVLVRCQLPANQGRAAEVSDHRQLLHIGELLLPVAMKIPLLHQQEFSFILSQDV